MLTIFHGTDRAQALEKINKEKNGLSSLTFSVDDFDEAKVLQMTSGADLFGGSEVLVLKDVLGDAPVRSFVEQHLDHFVESQTQIFLLESKKTKKDLAKFIKAKALIEVFDAPKESKGEQKFDMFKLTDALGRRDKKNLWVLLQVAKRNNVRLEEVHGLLWWQMKNMLLVSKENKNPGLHPYAFQKTQSFLKNYEKDLVQKSRQLIASLHDARTKSGVSFELSLENFVLSL